MADMTPDTTVNGISRFQTKDATPTVLLDVPLSPGGNCTVEVTVTGVQVGGTGRFRDSRVVDVYCPLSGAPTVDATTAPVVINNPSTWPTLTIAANLVGGIYHLQVSPTGVAATTINWSGTYRSLSV